MENAFPFLLGSVGNQSVFFLLMMQKKKRIIPIFLNLSAICAENITFVI